MFSGARVGRDTVASLDANDTLEFRAYDGLVFGDLEISLAGRHTLIAWHAGEILVRGAAPDDIGAGSFDFG